MTRSLGMSYLPNIMMRRTPARVPVTDQNSTGLNQSSQSPQSLMKKYFIRKYLYILPLVDVVEILVVVVVVVVVVVEMEVVLLVVIVVDD